MRLTSVFHSQSSILNSQFAAAAALLLAVGCTHVGGGAASWRERAVLGGEGSGVRVAVYGDLFAHLPKYNATPALDEFLYGPVDDGHTILRNPQGMALAGTTLLVCDQGYQDVIGINLANGRSWSWADREHLPKCPVGITVGPDGRVYVADTTLCTVLVYEADGRFVQPIARESQPLPEGGRRGPTYRPCSVAIAGIVLYIGNLGGRCLERYDLNGGWLEPLCPPREHVNFFAPTGLAVAPTGLILVTDSIQGQVFRVTPEGRWLEPMSNFGRLEGELVRPKQLAWTGGGLIAVTDAARQSLALFNGEGQGVAEVHEVEAGWTGWTLPAGVLALSREQAAPLLAHGAPEPAPDEYLLVSDTLGRISITLLGISGAGEAAHE